MEEDLLTDGPGSGSFDEKFYRPLSSTGYLTPLQRKKLREKRGFLTPISEDSNVLKKSTKPRSMKRKREFKTNVPSKREKITKRKELVSQRQCSVARVISKTNNNLKEKKFFKTSSPSRLEKVNFSIPFVFKKNIFSAIDKTIKENSLLLKKSSFSKENHFDLESSDNLDDNEIKTNVVAPCIIKINNDIGDIPDDSVQLELTDEKSKQILSLFDFDWPSDEILLKRQTEAREKFRKQKILNELLEDSNKEQQQNIDEPVQKLYPVFYLSSRKQSQSQPDNKRKQRNGLKRVKESCSGGEQMVIDAGQKEFGAKICSTCNMIYSVDAEEDGRLHLNYHDTYLINLKFNVCAENPVRKVIHSKISLAQQVGCVVVNSPLHLPSPEARANVILWGWKEENVIGEYADGRVIMVRRNEQSFKIKKIEDVLEIANRDLGFCTSSFPSKLELTFLLFVSNAKQVAGCVVAEPITQASRLLQAEEKESAPGVVEKETIWRIGNWYASSETVPAVCGVNRIWVAHNYRRKKVASRMIDCLRYNFIHGYVIGLQELAFTDPSPDGREFAASYTGTNHFLVYK